MADPALLVGLVVGAVVVGLGVCVCGGSALLRRCAAPQVVQLDAPCLAVRPLGNGRFAFDLEGGASVDMVLRAPKVRVVDARQREVFCIG